MQTTTTNQIRPLTDQEIARLEAALGQPVERIKLAYWVSRAVQAFIMVMTLPPPRQRRDDLKEIAEQGHKWIKTVEQSRSTRLLLLEVEQLMSSVRTFCDAVASLAQRLDQAVGPGHPRTNVALEAFLEPLIGIAKRAKVLPSTPSRALLGASDSPRGPPFFGFVTEALDIAMDVIRSSPLPQDQMDAALAALSNVTDQSLVKTLEGLRGRLGDYREGEAGLVEWHPAEEVDWAQQNCESDGATSLPAIAPSSSALRATTRTSEVAYTSTANAEMARRRRIEVEQQCKLEMTKPPARDRQR